jgi:hypothetical protein
LAGTGADNNDKRRLAAMHCWPWRVCGRASTPIGATGSALAVVLRSGRRIEVGRGFDTGALEQLIRVLEGV